MDAQQYKKHLLHSAMANCRPDAFNVLAHVDAETLLAHAKNLGEMRGHFDAGALADYIKAGTR